MALSSSGWVRCPQAIARGDGTTCIREEGPTLRGDRSLEDPKTLHIAGAPSLGRPAGLNPHERNRYF
jgi:hypothetical protein